MLQIRVARGDEEKIRQPVEIDDRRFLVQRDQQPLRTAADGARDVQVRRRRASAGKDEVAQRCQLALHRVDRFLQLRDARRIGAGEAARPRRREVRADVEQIGLDAIELRIERRRRPARARHAEERVQLIDRAVGLDARIVFPDTRAAE